MRRYEDRQDDGQATERAGADSSGSTGSAPGSDDAQKALDAASAEPRTLAPDERGEQGESGARGRSG
ncbi:MAG TPA: hypothetical protein VKA84_15285 [Gemmatimonadaceae bacterium]|nr:hypothetical protein [Gemmatimonadaceae bacterium]